MPPFANPDIDAILCLRGGYGTLLDALDFDLLRAKPQAVRGLQRYHRLAPGDQPLRGL